MLKWTKAQWDAFGRHVLTAVGSALAVLVLTGAVSQTQAAEYLGHLTALVTSVIALVATVAPLYAAIRAAHTASPEKQAEATVQNLDSGAPLNGKKAELIAAVANQPEVKEIVMQDPVEAEGIPSMKVQ